MKESYITKNFKKTAAARFPVQAEQLNAAFYARLQALRQDNAGATKEKQRHLENQILPGIAAYETLQTVMPKDEALETIHSYVEKKARRQKKLFLRLIRIPGLYKKVPGIFSEQTPKLFGVTAGFASRDIQTTGGVWRIDMTKCPCTTAVRSCVTASATATISPTTACTPSSTGTAPRRLDAGATAAISA